MNTEKEFIETEAALIAALSQQGRYLEYTDYETYVIRTSQDGTSHDSMNGKDMIIVADEVAEAWTAQFDYDSPEYGVWCSCWHLPAFWPWKEPD